ncbi:MAG: hypothetical protein H6669_05450 [Ardenticatenaceae bacterium]|nr:hypothetical protein [Ardenticatenaceae bacterium]
MATDSFMAAASQYVKINWDTWAEAAYGKRQRRASGNNYRFTFTAAATGSMGFQRPLPTPAFEHEHARRHRPHGGAVCGTMVTSFGAAPRLPTDTPAVRRRSANGHR